MARIFPSEIPVTIPQPTKGEPYPDVHGIRFNGIEHSKSVSFVGSAFFEGEESAKDYKMLYRETPKLTATLYAYQDETPIKTVQLPATHLIEFSGLDWGKLYEVEIKSTRSYMDTRHD